MDNKIYLIHEDDYLDHIDGKLDMYELLTELVRAVRSNLEAGETAQAMRTLCAYENKAHEVYEDWCIPDEYAESGDPDDLAQLMEDELLPADDDDGKGDNNSLPFSCRLMKAAGQLSEGTHGILTVINELLEFEKEIAEFEEEIDRLLNGDEGPENACAE